MEGVRESLDPELGHTVQEGIGGAYAVAGQLEPGNGAELIDSAQDAFIAGWGNAMWFAAAIALATAIVAFRLIPREPTVPELAPDREDLIEAPAVEKALATVS